MNNIKKKKEYIKKIIIRRIKNIDLGKRKELLIRQKKKMMILFLIFTFVFFAISGKILIINAKDGDRYAKRVLKQQTYKSSVINYKRGDIIDRNGTVLARSIKVYNVVIDPKVILEAEETKDGKGSKDATIRALVSCFDITSQELAIMFETKPKSHYVVFDTMKNLKSEEIEKFEELKSIKGNKITGVWYEENYIREYPMNTVACNVVGFIQNDKGITGIESYYNDELIGVNGQEFGYFNSNLDLERTVKPADNGNTLILTIDANVQSLVQKKIKKFSEEIGAKNIGVMINYVNNGEIIAMASYPEFDLNNPNDLTSFYSKEEIDNMTNEDKVTNLNKIWKNFCVSDAYEPGSTFKPVTIASALDEDIIKDTDTFWCDGFEKYGNAEPIKCNKISGHGTLSLKQTLMYSCNDALMQIAQKEGKDLFYKYQKSFGFGSKTGIDLPAESEGILKSLDKMGVVDLATSSFGQTFITTMVQMSSAISSVVNGGHYYEPHIVKQIKNDNGATIKNINPILVKQTISEKTSNLLKEYLFETVENGTAHDAKIEGYEIGGKTGTAQKYPREDRKYLVSFIGCVPAMNPEIVIYVVIDEPQVEKQADSTIATKFAGDIMKTVLPFLGIYSDKVENNNDTQNPENTNETDTSEQENQTQPQNLPYDEQQDINGNEGILPNDIGLAGQ